MHVDYSQYTESVIGTCLSVLILGSLFWRRAFGFVMIGVSIVGMLGFGAIRFATEGGDSWVWATLFSGASVLLYVKLYEMHEQAYVRPGESVLFSDGTLLTKGDRFNPLRAHIRIPHQMTALQFNLRDAQGGLHEVHLYLDTSIAEGDPAAFYRSIRLVGGAERGVELALGPVLNRLSVMGTRFVDNSIETACAITERVEAPLRELGIRVVRIGFYTPHTVVLDRAVLIPHFTVSG